VKKTLFFVLFCNYSMMLNAQAQEETLQLSYDPAGNQTLSALVCINCPESEAPQDLVENPQEEPEAKTALNQLRYYPNPVAQELNLTWENTPIAQLAAVSVYTLNGKRIAVRKNLNAQTQLTLHFSDKASGIYTVEALSSDGKTTTFKILKQ
jgi:Secretion system C-terminal sorting domain